MLFFWRPTCYMSNDGVAVLLCRVDRRSVLSLCGRSWRDAAVSWPLSRGRHDATLPPMVPSAAVAAGSAICSTLTRTHTRGVSAPSTQHGAETAPGQCHAHAYSTLEGKVATGCQGRRKGTPGGYPPLFVNQVASDHEYGVGRMAPVPTRPPGPAQGPI